MAPDFDAIVLGSGHNGLILAAYLGRAGLRTLTLEQGDHIGGGLQTTELPPGSGFHHNLHSFYHRGVTSMPWYRELELEQRGARYITPERNVSLLLPDRRRLEWWSEFDRTEASFAELDRIDAQALRRWREDFRPIVREMLIPEAQRPPLPSSERRRRLQTTPEGRLLSEVSQLSPLEFVQQNFRHPTIRAGLLFFNGLREVDLRQPGFGHHIPALLASNAVAQICAGGSGQLAKALQRAVEESGGRIHANREPAEIVVRHGQARGVRTRDGQELTARAVVSGLNPQQTFLELLKPDALPATWRQRASGYRYNLLAPLFSLHLNLSGPPPYPDCETQPPLMVILGLDHFDQFAQIVAAHEQGRVPPPVLWGSCPTLFDPRQAPPASHTAFLWEKAPYRLEGDPRNWQAAAAAHGERILETWERFAPGLRARVFDRFERTPADIPRALPNMRDGDLLVGAFSHGQIGYDRPFPGAGHYRTCVSGLYLCGSCCHPGGNITGLPGYNCAQVVCADLLP